MSPESERVSGPFDSCRRESQPCPQAGGIRWIIDPLDGTTNYAHGYPVFSVSIGLEIDGELEWGSVFDPIRKELYTARRGGGAFCNGVPLHVSSVGAHAGLLATGFPYDIRTTAGPIWITSVLLP